MYANSSRTSLCLTVTRPPFLHPNACSTENFAPHPSHFFGKSTNSNPYLILKLSLNAPFDRLIPLTMSGMMDNHPPVFFPRSVMRIWRGVMLVARRSREAWWDVELRSRASTRPACIACWWSLMCHPSPVSRALVRTAVHSLDEVWLWGAAVVGFGSPMPAFLTGSEVRARRPLGIACGVC